MDEQEFKELRHRFYKLGKVRCLNVLIDLGKYEGNEPVPDHDETKEMLESLNKEGRTYDLIQAIEHHEEAIQKEKEERDAL